MELKDFNPNQVLDITLHNLPHAAFILDAQIPPKIIYCNPMASEIFGYKEEAMLNRTTAFLHISPQSLKEFQNQVYPSIKEKKHVFIKKFFMKRKNNQIFPTNHTVAILEDQQGNRIGWVSIVRDLSDQIKIEESFKVSEERFRKFFENNLDYCYMVSPEGTILDINQKALDVLGCKKNELVGKPITTIYSPASVSRAKKLFAQWKKTGQLENEELKIITKKGNERIVLLSVNAVKDAQGRIAHSISMQKDITEKKNAEVEKERFLKKTKENLVLIKQQNAQLVDLEKKLKDYAKRLERKVKRLEKVKLTKNEKVFFSTLTEFPGHNDQKLSQQTNIGRSTITAIRNRLKNKHFFKTINIPHHSQFGCELVNVLIGQFDHPLRGLYFKGLVENLKDLDEAFFIMMTEKKCLIFLAIPNLLSHRKTLASLKTCFNNLNASPHIYSIQFPCQITNFDFFFDFQNFLNRLFGWKSDQPIKSKKHASKFKLTKNQKKILYLLTKHPGCSVSQLAGLSGLSQITAGKIKKILFDSHCLTSKIIPNLKKLNCQSVSLHHVSPAQEISAARKKFIEKFQPGIFFDLYNETDLIELMVHKEGRIKFKYEEFLNHEQNHHNINFKKFSMLINEIKYQKIDFAPLIKKSYHFRD